MTVTRTASIDAALQVLCRALEDPRLAFVEVERTAQSFFVRVEVKGSRRVRPTSGRATRARVEATGDVGA